MDTYSLLRQIADSWVLLAMTLFFLGCCAWAFRPGSRDLHDEAASLALRPGTAPGIDAGDDAAEPPALATRCGGDCASCACAKIEFKEGGQ